MDLTSEIVRLYREGVRVPEIAQRVGRSRSNVYVHLHRAEVPLTGRYRDPPPPNHLRPAYWELSLGGWMRQGEDTNPVVMGRRFCTRCGHWRHLCDFGHITTRSTGMRPVCYACGRLTQRRRWRERSDVEVINHREYDRIYREVQRRANGIKPADWLQTRRTVIDRNEAVYLSVEPLLAAMGSAENWENMARAAGVPPRSILRLRTGESAHVRLDVADRLALALGVPLEVIYEGEPTVKLGFEHTHPRP